MSNDSTMTKTPAGTTIWTNAAGDLHRTDGPAFIDHRRRKEEYWIDGKRISKDKFDILNGKEVKVSPKDECQVCAGTFSLKNGLLVKHGFRRPGTGRLHGRCMGQDHLPFPDTKALVRYFEGLKEAVVRAQDRVSKFDNDEIKSVDATTAFGKTYTVTADSDAWTWEREYGRAKRNAATDLKELEFETERVEKRIEKANEMKNTTTESLLRGAIRNIIKEELLTEVSEPFQYGSVEDADLPMELLGWMTDARNGITIKHFVEVTEAERSKVVQAMKKLVLDGLVERGEGNQYSKVNKEQVYYVTLAGRKAFNDYMNKPQDRIEENIEQSEISSNIVEYAIQEMLKGKSISAAAKSVVKKFSGQENMFLGRGIINISQQQLEEKLWERLADRALTALSQFKAGKEDMALLSVLDFYKQKENLLPKLKNLVIGVHEPQDSALSEDELDEAQELSHENSVDESWLDDKGTAKKLSKTIEKKYGKGFGGKIKWADEWSDNPKAVAGTLAKVAGDDKKK